MAVKFSANNERYGVNTSWGLLTAFSITCWMELDVDRNDFSCIWSLYNNTGHFVCLRSDARGNFFYISSAGAPGISLGPIFVGTDNYHYFGFSFNGAGTCRLVYKSESDDVFDELNGTSGGNLTGNFFRLGDDHNGGNWLNGSITAVKVWTDRALDRDELEQESYTYKPVSGNVQAWYPWISTADSETDFAGNGNDPVAVGSASSVFHYPPISWWASTPRVIFLKPPIVKPIGQVTETDRSQRLAVQVGRVLETDKSKRTSVPASRAKEIDASRVVRPQSIYKPGQTTTTNTAQPVTHRKSKTVNMALQITVSRPVTRSLFVGRVVETNFAPQIENKLVLRSNTTDIAESVVVNKNRVLGIGAEADILRLFVKAPWKAKETDSGQQSIVVRGFGTGQTGSVSEAQPVRPAKTHTMPQATETDKSVNLPIELRIAEEADLAFSFGRTKSKIIHWPLIHIYRGVYKVYEKDFLPKPMQGVRRASEVELAREIRPARKPVVSRVIEVDVSVPLRMNTGETDTSTVVRPRKLVLTGQAWDI